MAATDVDETDQDNLFYTLSGEGIDAGDQKFSINSSSGHIHLLQVSSNYLDLSFMEIMVRIFSD